MARLSPAHLEQIREGLASGRRPRVVFTDSAGQMAGQVGQVVALTDPAASDEWVVVRFGRDELPFSPADLELPARGAKRAASGRRGNGEPSRAGNGTTPSPTTSSRTTTPSRTTTSNRTTPNGTTANGRAVNATVRLVQPTATNGVGSTKDSAADGPPPAPTRGPDPAAPGPAREPRPARPRPAKQPASLAVTVAYAEGTWTVAASQGTRTISRPQPIRAAEALRLVAMLDAPAVHDAVEHIIAAEKATAEQKAQRLRTELAEIEARLAELRDAR